MSLTASIQKINRTDAKNTYPFPVPYGPSNMSAGTAANAAAQVTIAADTGVERNGTPAVRPLVISEVWWSYSAAPTGGNLTLIDSGGTHLNIDIAAGGKDSLTFTPPILCGSTSALTATLAAAAGVTGKVGIVCWRQE